MKHRPDDILDAAVGLLDREGVGVSMASVAAAAGVSNGTLFHYFPTKQAAIDALYLRLKTDLSAAIGEVDAHLPARDQSAQVWRRWCGWARNNPSRHRVTMLLQGAGLVSAAAVARGTAMFARFRDVLAAAEEAGQLVDLPLDYLISVVITQLELAVASDLTDAQCAAAFDVAWHGITHSPEKDVP